MRFWTVGTVLTALAVSVAAGVSCGEDDEANGGTTPTSTGGTSSGGSGGGGGGGQAGGGGEAGATGSLLGAVVGYSASFEAGGQSITVAQLLAGFGPRTPYAPAAGCTESTVDGCVQTLCPRAGAGGAATAPTAGVITVTGGYQTPLTLTPDTAGVYTSDIIEDVPLFGSGELINVAAAGADVVAFSQDVSAPASVVITAPDLDVAEARIDTGADLAVAWTGASTSQVLVSLTGRVPSSGDRLTVQCSADAAQGSLSVPAAALVDLTGLQAGLIEISVREVRSVPIDTDVVRVMLLTGALTPLNDLATASARFQ